MTTTHTSAPRKTAPRIGLVLQILVIVLLLFDAISHILNLQVVKDATGDLGLRDDMAPITGIVMLVILILYTIPATSILGAIVLTGYLGGAVLTNWRVEKPLLSTVFFAIYVGIAAWGALYLRDERVRSIIPLRRP
ncbi:DoxX family protein [Rhodococcus sp. IEGM 1401]|uniref:DoxX family protein n=1 Tax=unclassified Rhodococcus (in: high G+C Gram-positive bacteria) TaxID=192944 RepID=UPI0022B34952|nr:MULTISPECIES: DoxX family protein [unclassified Rhodococcus (in: high G+C Gram-positive bacteria)]MCZ4563928.1 DoxX family protein [Rhodococcus sp. IEGM 1401]MDI9924050.1 DoxX family protein [Rhodococcus sp. IEGM 1372]MDV8036517.1 DoxX family protein [Rhodococcus sp. IEGM 1414]